MMNGVLMRHGFSPISIPTVKALEFNRKMVTFYLEKDATEMMAVVDACRSEQDARQGLTPSRPSPSP